jgi:hypothetical protein
MEVPKEDDNKLLAESSSGGDVKESPLRRKCKECKQKESVYQCPECDVRTCSMECVKSHKSRTGCTGKRKRGAFLPLCRMTDSSLRSDYFLLEEVLDRMPRDPKSAKVDNASRKARKILQQCGRREIQLQVMPPMMERHKTNTSWYSAPRDTITWKVEVILHPSLETITFQLSEDEKNVITHIRNEFDKVKMTLNGVHHLFVKQLPTSAKNPRYFELQDTDSLRIFLPKKGVVEHPTIYCVPADSVATFPTGTDKITEVLPKETTEISNANTSMEMQTRDA